MKTSKNTKEPGMAAREQAHSILHQVMGRKRKFDDVLKSHKGFRNLSERDRTFVFNLVATTLRHLGQIDAIISERLERSLPNSAAAARNALRLGICQLLFLSTHTHAAVNTSVELASRSGPKKFKGVVNGILRHIVREGAETIKERQSVRQNVPKWMWNSWEKTFGATIAEQIAATHLTKPPLDLTVPKDPDEWADRLGGKRIGLTTVRLMGHGQIELIEGYKEGQWWVQDAAAALPAQILTRAITAGSICDLCAAPGGKTSQLLSAGHEVTAVDNSADRLNVLDANMVRLNLKPIIIKADILSWNPEKVFDAVLLDPPCTATGTIRRHPDIPHLKSLSDVNKQVALQRKFLDRAIRLTAPGGIIVYSVCSIEKAEGIDQVTATLSRYPFLEIDPISTAEIDSFADCRLSGGFVQTTPAHLAEIGGVDGFFIARLRKKSSK